MTWSTPRTFSVGEVLTAANLNTYVSNDLSWLTNFSSQVTTTSSSTNNVAYSDIGVAGPAVTITTGTQVLLGIGGSISNNTVNDGGAIGFNVSGATTSNASSNETAGWAHFQFGTTASFAIKSSSVFLVTGLTAGSNTFTLKYKAITGGVATFSSRTIWAWALPSS